MPRHTYGKDNKSRRLLAERMSQERLDKLRRELRIREVERRQEDDAWYFDQLEHGEPQ